MRPLLYLILAFSLAACNLVYKQDIQQGNVLDEDDVAQLELGMTKRQVAVLLGSPSIASPFHASRWDYMNTYSRRGATPNKRVLTLIFDRVDRLEAIEGSYLDQDSVAAQALRELQQPSDTPIQDMESIRQDP
ncbi:outer membrane protein assembly factor BamE [Wenzhouxiangella marina]|uniref:Outer membrane protein assembly factor BamE n=1 Tax=Wenzhouxiangella marina TaxID=1579979 RepID=A0A0K0XWZ6_9GAMM|nr:outer membrane protein assembly factor BamE [Wenzhouxiangella marina]AKS42204.1 Outer membrane protein assembly factor BamE [Wenzhouxiangella marina]MBB6086024.1 outer membrane protein assembly factor BamE [Wenzhouxiangella marina]